MRRGELDALHVGVAGVVPEPVFAGFKGLDDGVPGGVKVVGCVLSGGAVAAADVAALRAAAEMEPPGALAEAVGTAGAGGFGFGVDAGLD